MLSSVLAYLGVQYIGLNILDMVVCDYNPATGEVKAEGLCV
jgi:hypothetical protein